MEHSLAGVEVQQVRECSLGGHLPGPQGLVHSLGAAKPVDALMSTMPARVLLVAAFVGFALAAVGEPSKTCEAETHPTVAFGCRLRLVSGRHCQP